MKLAFAQANKNLGNTNDNPVVGCVVTKDDNVISSECTGFNGIPHAEFNAIKKSRTSVKGSKLYVTMEPCSHYGKTPPCTNLIINSKVKEVFYSLGDHDLRSKNKAKKILRKKNIFVKKNICIEDAKIFYRSYTKSHFNIIPFVTCKIAVSKDFYTIDKKKRWITNKFSRARAHLIRSTHDCIITSYRTILKDNSKLTCRIPGLEIRSPSRIILDKNLNISLNSNIIKESKKYRTIIIYNKFNKKKIQSLKNMRIETIKLPVFASRNFDLKQVLHKIKSLGFKRVLVEAGFNLTADFLNNNLVDDFNLFVSNKKLGTRGMNNIKNTLKVHLKNKNYLDIKVNLFGEKLLLYRLK